MKHEWIIKFLNLYIKDPNIIGLVKKYLKVGVLDGGELMMNEEGSAQGNIISPILANIYMHNVLTLWYKFIITKECKGDNFLIVYADVYKRQEQQYVAISATKDKIAVSLRGKIKNIGKKNLDIMFEKNPYMKKIYPGDTKDAIEVFRLYEAQGEYFDISNPSNIVRDTITIGKTEAVQTGYFIGKECIGCKLCCSVCPQKCIDISSVPVTINQNQDVYKRQLLYYHEVCG